MTSIQELDRVVLTDSLPQSRLQAGDVGTVVLIHQGGAGYEVEFCTLEGETVAVVTVTADQVRAVSPAEIANARKLAG